MRQDNEPLTGGCQCGAVRFRAGVGLNEAADDFFSGAGLSFRL